MLTAVEKSGEWEFHVDQWPGLWRGAHFRIKSSQEVAEETAQEIAALLKTKRLAKLESRRKAKERRLGNQ